MPESLACIAHIYKKMRQSRFWTPEELAKRAGLPVATILAYESCPASMTTRTATQVLDVMPFTPMDETLFDEPDAPFPSNPPAVLCVEMDTRMLEWKVASSIDKARFRVALDQLDHALALRPWPERIGRLLLSKAEVLGELSRERHALGALYEAEGYLDITEEPHLWLRLRIDQMYFLCHLDRYPEAEAYRLEARELADRVGRDREHQQILCLEGRIAAGLDQMQKAYELLQEAREELLAAGKLFEAGCASFDLAAVLAARGHCAELKELARQMEPWGQEKRLSDASRTTVRLLCRMVGRGSFKPEMGRRFAADFRKTDTRLTRPFELPGEQSNAITFPALQEARDRAMFQAGLKE